MSQFLGHDPLCTWRQAEEADAGDPRRWLAGGLAVCDCDKITKVREEQRIGIEAVAYFAQQDMLAKCIAETQRQLFRKNGMLNSIGSSVDEGSSVQFCCACDGNQRAAENLIAALRALQEKP